MDIKPTKLTTSDIYIGDKTDDVNFEVGAVETYIGDNTSKKGIENEVHKHELSKLTSVEEDKTSIECLKTDSGCGDAKIEVESSNLKKIEVLSDFEDDEECEGITWKWQEAMRDDVGAKGLKCVDVLDEIESENVNENSIYRSTPVRGRRIDKDYSDVSSEVLDEFDLSAEACSHHVHYPSLLSTSVEDDDDDSTGFHCNDFKNPSTDAARDDDDDVYNLFDDDLSDPHLRMWLRNKLDRSVDTSEQSESNDEELMRLHGNKAVTMVDKEIQVSEGEILLGENQFAQMDSWFREGASLQVKSRTSRQTQTELSFLSERLVAGKDEGSVTQTTNEEEVFTLTEEGETKPSSKMNEHVKKLMTALPGIPPVATDDGNMWLVPTVDENGNFFNVVVDDGSVWDIFVFRPSNPTTVGSTQTNEEEFTTDLITPTQNSSD